MYYLGVDLGGTTIKAGIVTEDCRLLRAGSVPTEPQEGGARMCDRIAVLCRSILEEEGMTLRQVGHLGLGSPGFVNGKTGILVFSGNLNLRDFPLRRAVSERLGDIPVTIGNDANMAAYGEYAAGSVRDASSAVVITLGTGVGAGVIINGEIVEGYGGGASEFGHMVIEKDGRLCTCGVRGCWEAYSSATGLIAMTTQAMEDNPDSLLWEASEKEGKVSGRTAFLAAKQGDGPGQAVVDQYIDYLACGVANVINALQPEVISLGGGVSKEGNGLLQPLIRSVRARAFGGPMTFVTQLRLCTLGNDAGMIGAAMFGHV